LATVSLQQVSC